MIRFLQRDNRLTKALFVVIIAATAVTMVIYPHWYSRFFASGHVVSQQLVTQRARAQLQQRNPQYADNPMILRIYEQQVGQQLVQQQILLDEAKKLGIEASNEDVSQFLHSGSFGEYLFPKGQFIGDDRYADFVSRQFNMTVTDFEEEIR